MGRGFLYGRTGVRLIVSGYRGTIRVSQPEVQRVTRGGGCTWQVAGPPPSPRGYMGFAECGGRLYVFGGYSDALGTPEAAHAPRQTLCEWFCLAPQTLFPICCLPAPISWYTITTATTIITITIITIIVKAILDLDLSPRQPQ